MVEETARGDADHAAIVAEAAARQNIGRKGTDISPGDLAERRGDLLDRSRSGAVAAIGCSRLDVFARPRVAMLSTGNEVIEPGTPLGSGKLYDVKRFTPAAVGPPRGGRSVRRRRSRARARYVARMGQWTLPVRRHQGDPEAEQRPL